MTVLPSLRLFVNNKMSGSMLLLSVLAVAQGSVPEHMTRWDCKPWGHKTGTSPLQVRPEQ